MDLVHRWYDATSGALPAGTEVWDAHTHSGHNDPDGAIGTPERLIEKLDEAGHAGAVLMSSQEPGGYPEHNDRILSETRSTDGRLLPFFRVDPRLGKATLEEAERCLDLGFRGMKLHPRAEAFSMDDSTVTSLAKLAAEAGIPVLVHAGRGMPALGRHTLDLLESVDELNLILAHAAISDLAAIGHRWQEFPGLFFDTAWWAVPALLTLFATVPAGRILYASDTPYGSPMMQATLTMRTALAAGSSQDELTSVFGRNLLDLLNGVRPAAGTPHDRGVIPDDPLLISAHAGLHAAITQLLNGGDPTEAVSLARASCAVPRDRRNADVLHTVAATIDRIDLSATRRSGIVRALIVAAAGLLTPDQPVPDFTGSVTL